MLREDDTNKTKHETRWRNPRKLKYHRRTPANASKRQQGGGCCRTRGGQEDTKQRGGGLAEHCALVPKSAKKSNDDGGIEDKGEARPSGEWLLNHPTLHGIYVSKRHQSATAVLRTNKEKGARDNVYKILRNIKRQGEAGHGGVEGNNETR